MKKVFDSESVTVFEAKGMEVGSPRGTAVCDSVLAGDCLSLGGLDMDI